MKEIYVYLLDWVSYVNNIDSMVDSRFVGSIDIESRKEKDINSKYKKARGSPKNGNVFKPFMLNKILFLYGLIASINNNIF